MSGGINGVLEVVRRHHMGPGGGIFSVCSAHPLVIEAALRHARDAGGIALIEATSNQVNQDGGYTGMRPADFFAQVSALASTIGLPLERLILGGDHLGPNCWQHLSAEQAMARSAVLIEQYVAAGFRKIHLDCSMACADDDRSLSDETIARRAATLAAVAEKTWQRVGGDPPVYIVGSEVPVPGGAHESLDTLVVTSPESAAATIEAHRRAFDAEGCAECWPRVVGLVVQPGVEFDHQQIVDYVPAAAARLSRQIERFPMMVYEAHSTDYQTAASLRALVRDHFAILKVGPGVTFALREALFALDRIESEYVEASQRADLKATVLGAMRSDDTHWRKYYSAASQAELLHAQQYSLSDRIRYYWPLPKVQAAQQRLLDNLNRRPPPLALVSQYLPEGYRAIRAGTLALRGEDLILHRISSVLEDYAAACRPEPK